MHKLFAASLALALAAPIGAMADTSSDIQALRHELEAMRADYQARLQALEQRLKAAEASAGAGNAAPAPTPAPPAPVAAAPAGGGANAFNPSMPLILSGLYTRTSQDPASYAISGVQLPEGGEFGPG